MKEHFPYVGVTGFTHREQVETLLSRLGMWSVPRLLMVGVLAGFRSMLELELKSKQRAKTPAKNKIREIFISDRRVLNTVHLNVYDTSTDAILGFMLELHDLIGDQLDAIQINAAWPDHRLFERYRKADNRNQFTRIILQIGEQALEEVRDGPYRLIGRLRPYLPFIDDILIDPSGGRGKTLDPEQTLSLIDPLLKEGLTCGIGVAGGLGPDTMHLLESILGRNSQVNFDAEHKLQRPDSEAVIGNNLDIVAASSYCEQAFARCDQFLQV